MSEGSLPSGGNIFGFFKFSRDFVESTESIEFKDNYGKTQTDEIDWTPVTSAL